MAITTDQYINNILPNQPFAKFNFNAFEKIHLWMYHHPTIVKIVELVALLSVFTAAVYCSVTLLTAGYTIVPIAIALAGILILKVVMHGIKVIDLAPLSHNMREHVFKEGGTDHARLYYDGDVPVFELKENITPTQAGYAHGFLLGVVIQKLRERSNFARDYANMPNHEKLLKVLDKVKSTLPPEYLEEMQGLVDGFNAWAESCWIKPKRATLDEILLFQMQPDSIHFNFEQAESNIACTAIINKDQNGELIFARNMDWMSLGVFGTYTLIIHRKHSEPGKQSTYEVGLPGLVGTLTGMNTTGLSLSMNVCSGQTHEIKGMPAAFYNRYCLEHFSTVKEVENYVSSHAPLGAYHLTVADKQEATAFHIDQGPNKKLLKRHLSDKPLIVTNCQYKQEEGSIVPSKRSFHCSTERHFVLNQYFNDVSQKIAAQNRDMQKIMEQSLALPYVNNIITTHRVVMLPTQGIMKVAFNNAYAGDNPLHTIQTK